MPGMRSALVAAVIVSVSVLASAQSGARTPWGDPDLQGIWPSGALISVPFERPPEFGTRARLTDKEFSERAAVLQRQADDDAAPISTGTAPSVNPPSHWLEGGRATHMRDGFHIRRAATEMRIPCYTSLDTARAAILALSQPHEYDVRPLAEYRDGTQA